MKKALITGVTGQDGSYLAEFLLEKGYDVHGIIRRSSVDYRERIAHLEGKENFHLHYGDMGDSMGLMAVISSVRPDEIYNLAAQSHVQVSFNAPEFTALLPPPPTPTTLITASRPSSKSAKSIPTSIPPHTSFIYVKIAHFTYYISSL